MSTAHARFTLDTDAARRWITDLLLPDDSDEHDHEAPTLPLTWDPNWVGQESRVDALVSAAQRGLDGAAAVITAPPGYEVFFDYSGTEDGGDYGWLVDVPVPSESGWEPDLRLAGPVEAAHRLVGHGVHGADAALAILEEAVAQANVLLARLEAYCSAMGRVGGGSAST